MVNSLDTEALNFDTEALDPLEISKADLDQYAPRSVEELNISLPQYEFLELLAVGGMGAIYKALQPKLDRLIAVKLLPKIKHDKYGFAERFSQEAKAMAKLSHPHIVPIFDFGETDEGQAYFVMEFVEGADLLRYLQGGQLTLAHFYGWIPQVCSAIQYAHNHDIVHRDIKPANILIDNEGNVKMADFGLAKLTGAQPVRNPEDEDSEVEDSGNEEIPDGVSMGTPGYAAPEQFREDVQVDGRADIYSLGVVMYQMLTGKMPTGAFPMPSEVNPHVDIRVDEVVMRAMQQDPGDRFKTISEISERLSAIHATENDTPIAEETNPAPPTTPSGKRLVTGAVQTAPNLGPSTASNRASAAGGSVAIPTDRVAAAGQTASLKTGRIAQLPTRTLANKPTSELRRAIDKRSNSVSPLTVFVVIAVIIGIIFIVLQSGNKSGKGIENRQNISSNDSQSEFSGTFNAPVKEPKPNPDTEAGRRLIEIEADSMETYASQVNAPFDESIEQLNALFLKTLNTQKADVEDHENPKLKEAFQTEINRVTNGDPPQNSKTSNVPEKILKMRANYLRKLNSLEQEFQKNKKTFEKNLDSGFKKLQEEFAESQNTDAAREVEYYRTNRARWRAAQMKQSKAHDQKE